MKNPREEYKRITGHDAYYESNIIRKGPAKNDYIEWLEKSYKVQHNEPSEWWDKLPLHSRTTKMSKMALTRKHFGNSTPTYRLQNNDIEYIFNYEIMNNK
jgi:hypothetical protein